MLLLRNIKISKRGKLIERMRNLYNIAFLWILLVILFIIPYVTADWDPYGVVGVKRDANLDQIKRTYRELARKLHPDKSHLDEVEAERKFIELNKAFNILKDPEKRSRYDLHGETEDNRYSRGYHESARRRRDHPWGVQRGARTFMFYRTSEGHLRRKSITAKQYNDEYIKESKLRPFFVFFYSDFCPSCDMIDASWTRITDELAKYNIGSFTMNVYHESRLSQELGVNSIPHIACLIDGQIKPYYESEISLKNVVRFTKNLLPYNLVPLLRTQIEQDRFLFLGPQYNRLSAIILHDGDSLKLRYLLLAYELRQYYRFGQMSTKLSDYLLLARKYNLSIEPRSRKTHLLVFDENFKKDPIINTNFDDDNFDLNQVKKRLTQWPFLQLPKLSMQQKFDDLCLFTIPKNGDQAKTRLCVILFATDTPSTLPARNKLMEFIEVNKLARDDRVVFTFVDPSKQSEFVNSLLLETKSTYPFHGGNTIHLALIMIERHPEDPRKALCKWIGAHWDPKKPDEIDRAKLELHQLIVDYKGYNLQLKDRVALGLLSDEEGPTLVDRVFWRLLDHVVRTTYYLTSQESLSTLIVLVLCALVTSLFLYHFPASLPAQAEPESMQNFTQQPKQEARFNHREPLPTSTTQTQDDELKIIELKAETYNGMVRLLKPGYRSIVLLSDRETKDTLLPEFKKAVRPYRRNKTLLFGYLCLDKNLDWYKSLLEGVLCVSDLNVNKKNCIGTVLSLNGFKKYFRVYHVKHHEIDYYDNETYNDGSFLGFNEDSENLDEDVSIHNIDLERNRTPHQPVYSVDRSLDRLTIWLDKMFDGLTKRYFLDNWPEEMK